MLRPVHASVGGTLLFTFFLVTNHKLNWNLTPFEIGALAVVLGVTQIATLAGFLRQVPNVDSK